MKSWWAIAFSIAATFLASGLIMMISGRPRGTPVVLLPPPTPAPLTVHAAGAVSEPGIYHLPRGSRVEAVLTAAGGALPAADLNALNLAAPLADGERVWVPWLLTASPQGSNHSASPLDSGQEKVDLNSATQSELEALPGIGPATAEKILTYRHLHGPFTKIDDLLEVEGIGLALFEKIKDYITANGAP